MGLYFTVFMGQAIRHAGFASSHVGAGAEKLLRKLGVQDHLEQSEILERGLDHRSAA